MDKILFLGYSNLLKNRILPILDRLPLESVSIAKFKCQDWDDNPLLKNCTKFDTYEDGLKNFDGNIVYISTVNSTHYEFARKSLEKGFNVIIDKPAALKHDEILDLVDIARKKRLLLSESTVYLFHPQFEKVSDIFKQNEDAPKLMTVHFSMPPFAPENFRYKKELGGGALFDTLPYVVSICRFFFNSLPESIYVSVNERNQSDLDIEYSIMLSFPNGKCMIGHFGFNTEYINNIRILGNRTNIEINRVFTIPESLENQIIVDHLNQQTITKSIKGNPFENYFKNFIDSLRQKQFDIHYNAILQDSEMKQAIIDKIK